MKILYITTDENNNLHSSDRSQGDYHENTILIGLRKLLKENCIEYPRKKILYHDFSSVPRKNLHGQGFSLYHEPMEDIPEHCRDLTNQIFDVILYGTVHSWNCGPYPELEKKAKIKFFIDGNDLYGVAQNNKYLQYDGEIVIGNQQVPAFKGQLILEEPHVYPIGVGLPSSRILPIDNSNKTQLFQSAYPRYALFQPVYEVNRNHHIFTNEEEYYKDMAKSWFGLSCKRGGWDAMRHYEIIAAGSVLLFRDYNKKPHLCSPVGLPTISYSSEEELYSIVNRLIVNNQPTIEYINLQNEQRTWLINNATTEARAKYVIKILENYLNGTFQYN